ncbi:MAG: glycosyltransferase family 2 protein, partial [Pyrinomonadaceae bacterium]|nr:glycosyltransferase family 2 protein [Pyrinomonadaceae bacterium]
MTTKPGRNSSPDTVPNASVIIPAYNSSEYLSDTLASVFGQTFSDYEVIVINDGSPDTEKLEQVLEPYRDRIVYLKHENRGAAAARNSGLRVARGEFIAFLDADDRWLSSYLQEQLEFLKKTGADIAYADALMLGDPQIAGRTYMELAPSRCAVTPESLLEVNVGVVTSGVVARKKLIYEVGLFDEGIRRGHDFDLWLRLAQKGATFACHPEVLLHYTVSSSGLSGNRISQLERRLELLGQIQARGGLTASEEAALQKNFQECTAHLALEKGKSRLLEKDYEGALMHFNQAKNLRPGWKTILVCWSMRMAPQFV